MMSRLAEWWRSHRGAVLVAGVVVAALAVAAAFIWPITDLIAAHDVGQIVGPHRATQLQTAREAVRTQLLTLAAGVFVAGALWFTAQNFRLSRQGQVTDRYTTAIEQLGSDKLDVRIGAIYALERIARDSAADHPTVVEVLAAFIREHSREQWASSATNDSETDSPACTIRPDVQAALTVIGRRNTQRDRQPIYLTGANLRDADLFVADLTAVNFTDANLTHANLGAANLTDALLGGANLSRAFLSHANLTGAELTHANLTHADLTGARLGAADLTHAFLVGALWSQESPVPEGWVRDPGSGLLRRADSDADDTGN